MKFIDEASIVIKSGKGGAGSVHFMRQKYKPRMGPDGGDGGKGGDVYFRGSHNMHSLLDFKFKSHYTAEDGEDGSRQDCNGKGGLDLFIDLPLGTQLFDAVTGAFVADIMEAGQTALILRGGRGGLGNRHFSTSVNQAPEYAQPGEPAQAMDIRMELKLLADVGIVGFPNAGKSSLIKKISAARPKVGDYPFTTLVPTLGVVKSKARQFVMADIPGLIEGAAEGKGLGSVFLKHCERSSALLYLLDLDASDGRSLLDQFVCISNELDKHSEEFLEKQRVVAINKVDIAGKEAELLNEFLKEKSFEQLKSHLENVGVSTDVKMVSAISGYGCQDLVESLVPLLTARTPIKPKGDRILGNPELLQGLKKGAQ